MSRTALFILSFAFLLSLPSSAQGQDNRDLSASPPGYEGAPDLRGPMGGVQAAPAQMVPVQPSYVYVKPEREKKHHLSVAGAVTGLPDRTAKTAVGMTDRTARTGLGMTDRTAKTAVGLSDRATKTVVGLPFKTAKETLKILF